MAPSSVERAEHQVARFRGLDGDRDGLEVAHLADEHDVRVLTKRRPQGPLEALSVDPDFALVDQALLVLMHELDRILDRDDVIGPVPIDVIDHRGEGRRLPGAGRSGDENEPLG